MTVGRTLLPGSFVSVVVSVKLRTNTDVIRKELRHYAPFDSAIRGCHLFCPLFCPWTSTPTHD